MLNSLTDSDIVAEDKLFATLDPATRRLPFPENRTALVTDTVGFIRKLPHHLVASFRSTLEEAREERRRREQGKERILAAREAALMEMEDRERIQ